MTAIAKNRNLPWGLVKRAVLWTAAAVVSFYVLGGVGMLLYIGKTSPKVQAAIADFDPGILRSTLEIIF
ncbi:MAG: hypothetical protein KF767_08965 [Bdellovibrionaceae bacterium]|nr:hypothetical protein [Pseudobdellovibrionaceae bacterium]